MNNIKFLLVDDDADVLKILKEIIGSKFLNSTIKSFSSPKEAINLIKNGFNPDIVFVDLNMPDTNGFELTQVFLTILPTLKIILFSGIIDEIEFVKNIKVGFMGVLQKPASPEAIYNEIIKVLAVQTQTNTDYIKYDINHSLIHSLWDFDLFVILAGSRYIKLFNKGEVIDHAKVKKMIALGNVQYAIKLRDYLSIPTSLFACISISQITPDEPLICGIFVKKENGFDEIISKGEIVNKSYIEALCSREIRNVYIEKQFEPIFIAYALDILNGKIKKVEFDRDTKIQLILNIASTKIQHAFDNPCDETISSLCLFSNVITRYLEDDKSAILDMINFHIDDTLKSHALNVATISVSILLHLEKNNLNDPKEKSIKYFSNELIFSDEMKKNLTIAALLHDLGSTLLKKKELSMTNEFSYQSQNEEIKEVCKFLSHVNFIPTKVIQIIKQHDERYDGSGPNKLFANEIDIYSQILIVADQFDRLALLNKSKKMAIIEMKREINKFNPIIFQALKELILEI